MAARPAVDIWRACLQAHGAGDWRYTAGTTGGTEGTGLRAEGSRQGHRHRLAHAGSHSDGSPSIH
jgi:hypothetical protein